MSDLIQQVHDEWKERGFPYYPKDADWRNNIFNQLVNFKRDRSEEHTSELQSRLQLACRLLLEKKKKKTKTQKKKKKRAKTYTLTITNAKKGCNSNCR